MQLSSWSLPVLSWKWWYIPITLIVVLLTPAIPTLIGIIMSNGDVSELSVSTVSIANKYLEILKFVLFTFVPIFLIALLSWRWARQSYFGLTRVDVQKVVIAVVVGFGGYILATYIFTQMVSGAMDASKQVGNSLGYGRSVYEDILTICLVGIITPIGEEFLFRGLLFRSIREGLGNTFSFFQKHAGVTLLIATLISSYFFMTSHGGGGQELQLYMIGLMGVIAALAYAWTGSIYAPILIHGLNNSYGAYMLGKPYFLNPTLSLAMAVAAPLITIGLVYLIQSILKKDTPVPTL